MLTELQKTDARLTILDYRLDQSDKALEALRTEYQLEHAALRKSLQGIEKNLQTIKWVSIGAGLAFISQTLGFVKAIGMLKIFL